MRKGSTYICHISVEELYKLKIQFSISYEKNSKQRVKDGNNKKGHMMKDAV